MTEMGKGMGQNNVKIVNDVFNDGYALVRGVFDPYSLAAMEAHLDRGKECIQELRSHPSIIEIAHHLCGPVLCDTGEAVVHHNPTRIYEEWHYDIPWDSEDGKIIPCWRFGIYFRDYTRSSGAISILPGSHLGKAGRDMAYKPQVMDSRPGDVVIWNLRAGHKPNTLVEGKPFCSPRNAVIFDYAAPGVEVERYKTWRKLTKKD